MKLAIAGFPKAGKTTLSNKINCDLFVYHTDDLIDTHDWSEASLEASKWFNNKSEFIIEGVAVPRALRKWLQANEGKPCDKLIWLDQPHEELNPGQQTMAKVCVTVMNGIKEELLKRGVDIIINPKNVEVCDKNDELDPEETKKEETVTKEVRTNGTKKDILTKRMKSFIEIFKKNIGRIQTSCNKSGVGRTTYYTWLDKSPKFKQAIYEAEEGFKDYVEGKIRIHIDSTVPKISADMCKFYAKTKMKDRGYVERTETEVSGQMDNKVEVEIIRVLKKEE